MKLHHFVALIPFIGIFGGIAFANKVTPYVLGMPFILFYLVLWVFLTSGIMAIVYKLDPKNKGGEET
ncbi:DUF3311 domain-containing protein [Cytobacillus depressus]|uniref:DUF3311 domain-containing protein n=1 Tax=Cytobacillus depressus TaxID=1602942 RepID=A0A6L3V6F3_9BACI|nr:DUF3311 domain-containing protein [Cytobacillus depressus]KAB2336718.1 DUF3311 domain-containing protein [Cytobacillus depressus]